MTEEQHFTKIFVDNAILGMVIFPAIFAALVTMWPLVKRLYQDFIHQEFCRIFLPDSPEKP